MHHQPSSPATDCPERRPIDPDHPSPDWFVGCWNVRVGRDEPRVKIEHRRNDDKLDLFLWNGTGWQPGDVLDWNERTVTLESDVRCISYWRRTERFPGSGDRIFAYFHTGGNSAELLPFERDLLAAQAAAEVTDPDVAWGAEEEGGRGLPPLLTRAPRRSAADRG